MLVDEFWAELPSRYRYNRQLQRQEDRFDDWDCSVAGFEGIRAQDILPELIRRFHFDLFIGFANIIDPFIDRSFGFNFDAEADWDRSFIDRVHARDEMELAAGRIKPTHMYAVMRVGSSEEGVHLPGLSPRQSVRVLRIDRSTKPWRPPQLLRHVTFVNHRLPPANPCPFGCASAATTSSGNGGTRTAAEHDAERGVEYMSKRPDTYCSFQLRFSSITQSLRIVVRQEDVVDVHAHAGFQARQHFEQQVVDVAAGLRDVRGVDEQDVAGVEPPNSPPARAAPVARSRPMPATPRLRNSRGYGSMHVKSTRRRGIGG